MTLKIKISSSVSQIISNSNMNRQQLLKCRDCEQQLKLFLQQLINTQPLPISNPSSNNQLFLDIEAMKKDNSVHKQPIQGKRNLSHLVHHPMFTYPLRQRIILLDLQDNKRLTSNCNYIFKLNHTIEIKRDKKNQEHIN